MTIGQSGGGSETNSDVFSPIKMTPMNLGLSANRQSSASGFEFDSNTGCIFARDLPDAISNVWLKGFVWKGVYLKLYTKNEGQKIKREMKALKHLAIEFLQTLGSYRVLEGNGPQSLVFSNINDSVSQDQSKGMQQILHIVLPLISIVESSSWVLLGTPIFPCRKGGSLEENLTKLLQSESNGLFKNSFLLSGASAGNFKIYGKSEEQSHSTSHILHSTNLNLTSSSSFAMLCNTDRLLLHLPKVHVIFAISQEEKVNILFTEYPAKGYLSYSQIKKMMGYAKLDISYAALNQLKTPTKVTEEQKDDHKPYAFEMLKLKRMGWSFNMIIVRSKNTTPTFSSNRRATDLLSHSEKHNKRDIRGNVIVFGQYRNIESMIHPFFISDSYFSSDFSDNNDVSAKFGGNENSNMKGAKTTANDATRREANNHLNMSFTIPKLGKEETRFIEYFTGSISKSIGQVCSYLENTDKIHNFNTLKEVFHKKGVNMRFEWIVFAKMRRRDMKERLGVDILVRTLKRILESVTSKKLKQLRKSNMNPIETSLKKDKIDEIFLDKSEFLMENYFKRCLAHYANLLIKGTSEVQMLEDSKKFFSKLTTNLFLSRLRTFDLAKINLDQNEFDSLMSSETLKDVSNLAYYNAHLFIDAIQHHFNVCLNYDIIQQLKNDKFTYLLSALAPPIRHVDISVIFRCDPYLSIREKSFLTFIKLYPEQIPSSTTSIEMSFPPALYKLRRAKRATDQTVPQRECFLREYYEFPDAEVLNDWVVLLESALNGVVTIFSEQNFITEIYIFQILNAFFIENDDQGCSTILDKINTFISSTYLCSPELTILTQTWYGILYEPKLLVECEQSYMMAILTLHKLYGDPRGRGGRGTPWELFITWRLSILSRLQGKIHDAEYVEELFDATMMTLKENTLNKFYNTHHIYSQPFQDFLPKEDQTNDKKTQGKNSWSYLARYYAYQEADIDYKNYVRTADKVVSQHPFSYWTNHLQYDENTSKFEVINQTLPRNMTLLKWMVEYMPLSHSSETVWETSYLKKFFLNIMQNAYNNSTSVSSLSGYSIDERSGKGRNELSSSMIGNGTPKGSAKLEKKQKKYNRSGNLVQIFEKDASTLSKREAIGVVYAWGQNNEGQVGTSTNFINSDDIYYGQKMRNYFPKAILTLKDTIIISVSCGHAHTMALTLSRRILAWGSNKSGQLGLGNKAPQNIFIPVEVPELENVNMVSCGTEHTVALMLDSKVYSWGLGDRGLLGLGNTDTQLSPKVISSLNNVNIVYVACGGLHTLAINKQGHVYSWGRGERGQLGIPSDQFDSKTQEPYSSTPKRIRGAIDGKVIVKVAAGEAHSLALTQNGEVYGWGYTSSGQLGLGYTNDGFEPNAPKQPIRIAEPVLIEKLKPLKIIEIFAGATLSFFMNDKKELFGCGLNDSNQLGIEKPVIKPIDHLRAGLNETGIPKKLECFNSIPLMQVACGENHSLALALVEKYYMLFSWGMQKHAQLGNGDLNVLQSTPRPLNYLQDVMIYSMACGSFHSVVVLGDPTKVFKEDNFIDRCRRKVQNQWNVIFIESKDNVDAVFEAAINNL